MKYLLLVLSLISFSCSSSLIGTYLHVIPNDYHGSYHELILKSDSTYEYNAVEGMAEFTGAGNWTINGKYLILNSNIQKRGILSVEENRVQNDSIRIRVYNDTLEPYFAYLIAENDSVVHWPNSHDEFVLGKSSIMKSFSINFLDFHSTYFINDSLADLFKVIVSDRLWYAYRSNDSLLIDGSNLIDGFLRFEKK